MLSVVADVRKYTRNYSHTLFMVFRRQINRISDTKFTNLCKRLCFCMAFIKASSIINKMQ